MKHLIPGSALLLLAGLCGPSAHADPVFTPGPNFALVSPTNGTTYYGQYPNTPLVPFTVQGQGVEITGAPPSTSYSVGWVIAFGYAPVGGTGTPFFTDVQGSPTSVTTGLDGKWKHYINNNTGSFSRTLGFFSGNYSATAQAAIRDPQSGKHEIILTSYFTAKVVQ